MNGMESFHQSYRTDVVVRNHQIWCTVNVLEPSQSFPGEFELLSIIVFPVVLLCVLSSNLLFNFSSIWMKCISMLRVCVT